jgi:hypothetical protein
MAPSNWRSCPFCGRQYGTSSFAIHVERCVDRPDEDTLRKQMAAASLGGKGAARAAPAPPSRAQRHDAQPESAARVSAARVSAAELAALADGVADGAIGPIGYVPCAVCGRTFAARERAAKHEAICLKLNAGKRAGGRKPRGVFDSSKQRRLDDGLPSRRANTAAQPSRAAAPPRWHSNWRAKHSEFQRIVRDARTHDDDGAHAGYRAPPHARAPARVGTRPSTVASGRRPPPAPQQLGSSRAAPPARACASAAAQRAHIAREAGWDRGDAGAPSAPQRTRMSASNVRPGTAGGTPSFGGSAPQRIARAAPQPAARGGSGARVGASAQLAARSSETSRLGPAAPPRRAAAAPSAPSAFGGGAGVNSRVGGGGRLGGGGGGGGASGGSLLGNLSLSNQTSRDNPFYHGYG